jgi:hypothetical protein
MILKFYSNTELKFLILIIKLIIIISNPNTYERY